MGWKCRGPPGLGRGEELRKENEKAGRRGAHGTGSQGAHREREQPWGRKRVWSSTAVSSTLIRMGVGADSFIGGKQEVEEIPACWLLFF